MTAFGAGGGAAACVRLAENGKEWTLAASASWPLDGNEAPADGEDGGAAEGAEDGGEDAAPEDPLADALAAAAKQFRTREFTFAIPLSKALVKSVRVPAAEIDLLRDRAEEALAAASPFPDEELAVGVEPTGETVDSAGALAAALPSAAAEEFASALESSKCQTVRTDILMLGWLHSLWGRIFGENAAGRRLVLSDLDDGWDLAVVDGGSISMLRNLGADESALSRELLLSLMQNPGADVAEIAVCSRRETLPAVEEACAKFGPVRFVPVGEEDAFAGIEGCARRTASGSAFDVTPASWSARLRESRFRRRLARFLFASAAVWAVAMGVLFGVPFAYDKMTDGEKAAIKRHAPAYREVKDMRDRVKLVQKYSDRARGALEMLKLSSDCLPEGVTLLSWQYRRGENVRISGEADQPTQVYEFKNALVKADVFSDVRLNGPSASRGKHRFDIEASFETKEEK